MNPDNLRNWLSSVVSDLRARKLLPVLALLIAAAIAIPLLLSHSGKAASLSPVPQAPVITAPSPTSTTPPTHHHEPKQNYLTGPSHNPFVSKTSTTASKSAGAGAGATTASVAAPTTPSKSASGGKTSSSSSGGATAVAAKTVTVSTPATTKTVSKTTTVPASLAYSNYEVEVSLLQTGSSDTPTVFHNLSRDQLLASDNDSFATFLGVRPDKSTAVFVLADDAVITGAGKCAPSAADCTFLVLSPGQTVTVVVTPSAGTASTYTLSYDKVNDVMSDASTVTVDQAGAAAVKEASAYVGQLRTIKYDQHTGLLSIALGSTVPVTP